MSKTFHIVVLLVSVWFCSVALADAPSRPAPASRPVPQIQRMLVISIDGLRPDVLLRANTPNLHRLSEAGSYSFWAKTIPSANTLPSHTSMVTGVGSETHGITFNDERAATQPIYPNAVTLFELAHSAGYSTALVSGKLKFVTLAKPGTVDWLWTPRRATGRDADVADNAVEILRLHSPQVMFVHFPGPDTSGHSKGWGSPEQREVIERIDEHVGALLNALRTGGLDQSTAIIVTADHGGAGKSHKKEDLRSVYIPWIIVGPGIRRNCDLTQVEDLAINTTDTFATASYLLGLELPAGIDGKPIRQALESYEEPSETQPAPATLPATAMP